MNLSASSTVLNVGFAFLLNGWSALTFRQLPPRGGTSVWILQLFTVLTVFHSRFVFMVVFFYRCWAVVV